MLSICSERVCERIYEQLKLLQKYWSDNKSFTEKLWLIDNSGRESEKI